MQLITFTSSGIYCPQGNFYIDPWKPVEKAVITHAHSDHARWGMKHYLCHTYTKPILQSRIDAAIHIETINYNECRYINGVKLSLHPAGHIIGSAQVRLEYKGFVSVISGDYKVENDGITTPLEVVRCNEFTTESTFGLPIYNWLSQEVIFNQLLQWITDNKANGKTSIFIAYSLGKAQRLMKHLEGVADIFVHSSIHTLNQAIETNGIRLPNTKCWQPETHKLQTVGNVVILPPALLGTHMIKKITRGAIAICSGWMQVRGSRRWQSADAGFAISDHADWQGLLQTVKATGAEKVYVTHGYTAAFSKYLNETGITSQEVITKYGDDEEPTAPEENTRES